MAFLFLFLLRTPSFHHIFHQFSLKTSSQIPSILFYSNHVLTFNHRNKSLNQEKSLHYSMMTFEISSKSSWANSNPELLILSLTIFLRYKMSRELRIMGVVEPFLLQVFQFSVKMLPTDNPVIIEVLQMLLNNQSTYYSYSSFTPARDIIVSLFTSFSFTYSQIQEELYKNYPLICTICPAIKKAYNEGFNHITSTHETELERVLEGRDPEENSLFVRTARDLRSPGKNFVNDAVKIPSPYKNFSPFFL